MNKYDLLLSNVMPSMRDFSLVERPSHTGRYLVLARNTTTGETKFTCAEYYDRMFDLLKISNHDDEKLLKTIFQIVHGNSLDYIVEKFCEIPPMDSGIYCTDSLEVKSNGNDEFVGFYNHKDGKYSYFGVFENVNNELYMPSTYNDSDFEITHWVRLVKDVEK